MTIRGFFLGALILFVCIKNCYGAMPDSPFISKTRIRIPIEASYVMSAYIDSTGGQVLLHLKPRDKSVSDQVIDVKTGHTWGGNLDDLKSEFYVYGFEGSRQIGNSNSYDSKILQMLGCRVPITHCTLTQDLRHALLITFDKDNASLAIELVDLRNLFAQLDSWLEGSVIGGPLNFNDAEWALLYLASHNRQQFEKWVGRIRSVNSRENWINLEHNLRHGPMLSQRALGFGKNMGSELKSEVEMVGLRIVLNLLVTVWQQSEYQPHKLEQIADLLSAINAEKIGDQVNVLEQKVTSQILNVLLDLGETQRSKMSEQLAKIALKRKSLTLFAYSDWLLGNEGVRAPWLENPNSGMRSEKRNHPDNSKAADIARAGIETRFGISSELGLSKLMRGTSVTAQNMNQELSLIRTLKNDLTLLAFSEMSGKMSAENGGLVGFSFIARALGSVQDGKFQIQILPNKEAGIKLVHGSYRVKISLILEHSRVDQCESGFRCIFSGKKTYARSQSSELVFRINQANLYSDIQISNFGQLIPDQGDNYKSTLKSMRLAVTSARIEPL